MVGLNALIVNTMHDSSHFIHLVSLHLASGRASSAVPGLSNVITRCMKFVTYLGLLMMLELVEYRSTSSSLKCPMQLTFSHKAQSLSTSQSTRPVPYTTYAQYGQTAGAGAGAGGGGAAAGTERSTYINDIIISLLQLGYNGVPVQ